MLHQIQQSPLYSARLESRAEQRIIWKDGFTHFFLVEHVVIFHSLLLGGYFSLQFKALTMVLEVNFSSQLVFTILIISATLFLHFQSYAQGLEFQKISHTVNVRENYIQSKDCLYVQEPILQPGKHFCPIERKAK